MKSYSEVVITILVAILATITHNSQQSSLTFTDNTPIPSFSITHQFTCINPE